MNVISKKLLMLSVALAALGVGSVFATGKKDPIVGSWNVALRLAGMNQSQGDTQLLEADQNLDEAQDEHGVLIPAVIKFYDDCTLVAEGIVHHFTAFYMAALPPIPGGTDSSIAVGTWKRIGKCLYAIELSSIIDKSIVASAEENGVQSSLRIKTKGIIRLGKEGRVAQLFKVESRAFHPKDICFKQPFKRRFPRLRGMLCRLCKPKKSTQT